MPVVCSGPATFATKRFVKRAAVTVGTFALLCLAAPAAAQDGAPVPQDEAVAAREAKTRFDEGLRRYAARDYEGAWAAFTQAYSVLKSADVLWNLCMAELRSGRPLDSIRHIRAYLRDPRTTDADRARARKYLAEASQKTAHVVVDAPAGAKIAVDGHAEAEGLTEPVDLEAGKHKVECKQGSIEQSVEVDLLAGQTVSVKFLPAQEGQTPASPTVVTVRSEAEAAPATAMVERPAEGPGVRTWLGFGLAGGALVATGVGVGFLVASAGAKDDAARLRSTLSDPVSGCYQSTTAVCRELNDSADSEVTRKNVATGAFVAAGALALGSAAVFIFWPERRPKIAPMVGAGGAGAMVTGEF